MDLGSPLYHDARDCSSAAGHTSVDVVTFLSVVNPQARPAGLVACLRSTRPRSGHFLSHVQEQLAIPFVTGFFDESGNFRSMGLQCAPCHSTVDDSFAPGIGKRLDGWANRDLNVGAIVSLAPNLIPFTDLLGVDVATLKKVLASWGPGCFDAELDKDGKALARTASGPAH